MVARWRHREELHELYFVFMVSSNICPVSPLSEFAAVESRITRKCARSQLGRNLRPLSNGVLCVKFAGFEGPSDQVRLTAIVTGSILFALVVSLSLFYFFRISVNFITISGLTVCFGMLLDNSILVLDAIHRRLDALRRADREGLSRRSKFSIIVETIVLKRKLSIRSVVSRMTW